MGLAGCERAEPTSTPLPGPYRVWLESPGGELPFGLELTRNEGGALEGTILNPPERLPVRVTSTDEGITLSWPQYDARIEAAWDADRTGFRGRWIKTAGPDGRVTEMVVHGRRGDAPRFSGSAPSPPAVAGRWIVDFESDESDAIAVLSQDGGEVRGTFLTTTGDYRYLAGTIQGDRLRLSCFDGAHAFLFEARLLEDGTLEGEFWSRDVWHERWTATREPEARMPDSFSLTSWAERPDWSELRFPDLTGRERSLGEAEFRGKARIIEIFGSWCPNCNDAAPFLAELQDRYESRGLRIVGLAFELTGEFDRDAAQLRRYLDYHDLRFPVLLAGEADKSEASRSLPFLDRLRSYPTTVFVRGDGRVRAVHQGYAGPATGEENERLRSRFTELVEELLASP